MTPLIENTSQIEDIDDPVEHMLKKTGCIEIHYQVQECVAKTRDWRKCQDQLQKFKVCMDKYRHAQEPIHK